MINNNLTNKNKIILNLICSCQNKAYICSTITRDMKNEINYKGKTIIEGTNGLFTAYYSNYSANLTKDFKTLASAKKQIDKWLA